MAEGKGRSSGQGVKLLYLRDYLHKYTNKDHPKNATEISKYLESKGVKADRKTIYNDILRLQTDFQEPIEYSASKKKGFYIAQPTFSLYELQVLMDSVRSADFLSSAEVSSMCKRIAGLTNIYAQEALVDIPFDDAPARPIVSELEKVAIIQQAIRENKQIRFRLFMYYPTDNHRDNHGKQYVNSYLGNEFHIVSPEKLVRLRGGKYGLICFRNDDRMASIADYKYTLDTIEDIVILSSERVCINIEPPKNEKNESRFEDDVETFFYDGFIQDMLGEKQFSDEIEERYDWIRDILEVPDKKWSYIFSHPNMKHQITLSFKKEYARYILEEFGHDVVLVPGAREYCSVTLRIPITQRFFDWLFSMRYKVWIATPFEVRELYKDYVSSSLKHYEYLDMSHGELLTKFIPFAQETVKDEALQKRLSEIKIFSTTTNSIKDLLIQYVESGNDIPTEDDLVKIAQAYGVGLEQLLDQLAKEYLSSTNEDKKKLEQALGTGESDLLDMLYVCIERLTEKLGLELDSGVEHLLEATAQDHGISGEKLLEQYAQTLDMSAEKALKFLNKVHFSSSEELWTQVYEGVIATAEILMIQHRQGTNVRFEEILEEFARPLGIDTTAFLEWFSHDTGIGTQEVLKLLEFCDQGRLTSLMEAFAATQSDL